MLGFFSHLLWSQPGDDGQKHDNLDEYVHTCMERWEIPGVAIGIVKDGQVILTKGYEVKNIDTSNLVNERTIFPIASVTKAFTATLIGFNVDEEKLTWDDPIIKHLPDFQLYDPHTTRKITIRDLLCHRSGLERAEYLWYQINYQQDEVLLRLRFLKSSWDLRSRL